MPILGGRLALAAVLLAPCAALAQSPAVPVPVPKNIILPNYDNVLTAGGSYHVGKALAFRAGFFASFSPIGNAALTPFQRADLYGATVGAAFEGEHWSGSLGLAYEFGSSTAVQSSEGAGLGTALDFRAATLLYAIGYRFQDERTVTERLPPSSRRAGPPRARVLALLPGRLRPTSVPPTNARRNSAGTPFRGCPGCVMASGRGRRAGRRL